MKNGKELLDRQGQDFETDLDVSKGKEGSFNAHEGDNANIDAFEKIMRSFFGKAFDGTQSWDELGLSSMASLQVRDAISNYYAIALPPECFETYFTPDQLKTYVLGNQGVQLTKGPSDLSVLPQTYIPWKVMGCLQFLCTLIILLSFCASIIPSWYMGKLLVKATAFETVKALGTELHILWLWFPIVVPAWML